jgi:chromosome partitioning protein
VTNQKGGVAKTTSVVCLGTAFAEQGLRVLMVDLDAQSCLTFSLGLDPEDLQPSVYEVLLGQADAADAVICAGEGIDVLPSTIELAGAERALLAVAGREFTLRRVLAPLADAYDVVLLDCSPSLGVLTLNALAAADEVLIPLQCEMLSHRGVGQLLDTIADVRELLNPVLTVRGILPTMFDGRTAHARAVLADVRQRYDVPVLHPPIPRSVRFAEAPGLGRSVLQTARTSVGAEAYREIAMALLRAWRIRPGRRPTHRAAARPPNGVTHSPTGR